MSDDFPQNPLLQDDSATFFWVGPQPPRLVGDFNNWKAEQALEFEPIGYERWSRTIQLPADAYIEYAFRFNGNNEPDPFNPRKTDNGLRGTNSYFYMPQAKPAALATDHRSGKLGGLKRVVLEHPYFLIGGRRTIYFYQPPVIEPCPLLVVYDGVEYLRRARLAQLVDRLIVTGRTRPFAMALIANAGQARAVEYACNDATLGFLLETLLPAAQEHCNLISVSEAPGAYAVLGASMGGLMALYTALRLPHIFGQVISQSGAFRPQVVVSDLVRYLESQPIRVWMDVGRFETLLDDNLRMIEYLRSRGYAIEARIYQGGHNYTAWRDDVWRGLEYIYPAVEG